MMAESLSTRFLIISDTHSSPLAGEDSKHAFRTPMPKADVLLHCGDLTMVGGLTEYRETLDMISQIDSELKLVIAGNHDLSLDTAYHDEYLKPEEEQKLQQDARAIWTGDAAKAAGVTYLDEGFYRFTLKSGAGFSIWASPYTPEFCNWGFPYFRYEDRFSPPGYEADQYTKSIAVNPIPDFPGVDIVMTHGPPEDHLGMTSRNADVGCRNLLRALRRVKPRLHCFGHIHEAWGAELVEWKDQDAEKTIMSRTTSLAKEGGQLKPEYVDIRPSSKNHVEHGKQTLLVNAAIMDLQYKPFNSPWIVDMDLTRASRPQ